VQAHSGFALEQARYVTLPIIWPTSQLKKDLRRTAPTILSAVQQTLSAHDSTSVTVVGHSLGAALALLDGLYLRIQLGTSVNVRVVGYGMPRVGNQAFANWVDSNLSGQVTHINNEEDPIPIVPGRFLGFHHASGEVHITDSGTWEICPGELFLVGARGAGALS
jgi:predicted lipase